MVWRNILTLTQGDRSVEIVLHKTDVFPAWAQGSMGDMITWFAVDQILFWGQYILPANGSIPRRNCWWTYSFYNRQIQLLDVGEKGTGQIGGGQDYGEIRRLPPAALLDNAMLGDGIVYPGGMGTGVLNNGTGLGQMSAGRATWDMSPG